MTDGTAPAPREHRWAGVLVALAAFLFLPLLPPMPTFPILSVLPIAETGALLLPTLAACFVVGWWMGGRWWLAPLWCALTVWAFLHPATVAAAAYRDVARGWALLVAGALGVVSFAAPRQRPFARATAAVGLAVLLALLLLLVGGRSPDDVRSVFTAEFARRNAAYASALQAQLHVAPGMPQAEGLSLSGDLYAWSVAQAYAWSRLAAVLYPALLALESLAATVLAWSLYHRLSRARIGAPLTPLRDFRFSDQLVWGFVAGLVIVLTPPLAPLRPVGANLVLFFGALYALRGFGVIAWSIARLDRGGRLVSALAVAALVVLNLLTLAPALGVGLMDTWVDWRGRTRPTS